MAPDRFDELAPLTAEAVVELDLETFSIFDPRRQVIFELNETSRWIWAGLSQGRHPSEVRRELSSLTGSTDTASRYVDDALGEWLSSGCLRPLAQSCATARSGIVTLAGVNVPLRVSSAGADPFAGSAWIRALWNDAPDRPDTVELLQCGSWWTLRTPWSETTAPATHLPPVLKAVVVDALMRQPAAGFFVHGGLLELPSGAALVMGPAGAGKSTLCAAAVAAGATCWSDDVTRILGDGRFEGVPFPLTLKTGSWKLLPDLIGAEPVFERADGQAVRFADDQISPMASPATLSSIYFLDRRQGGAADVERVPAGYALRRLIQDGHAYDHRLDPEHLRRLAMVVAAANCFRLRYADARQAAVLLMGDGR